MNPLLIAAFIVFCEAMCFTTSLGVVHDYVPRLGGDPTWVGLILALVSGPKIITGPMWGTLSDRYGRRRMLAINTVGTLTGSILWAAAPLLIGLSGFAWLAISRVALGLFGGQAGLTMAIAADVTAPEKRAASMGLLGAAFGLAFTIGPPIGGWIGEHISDEAVGWFCAVLQTASLLAILLLLPETAPSLRRPIEARATISSAVRAERAEIRRVLGPLVITLLTVTFLMMIGQAFVFSTLGEFAKSNYKFSEGQVGMAFGLVGLVAVLVQGGAIRPLLRRYREASIAYVGFFLTAAGLIAISYAPSSFWFYVTTTVTGVGIALSSPCISGLVSRSVDERSQGVLNGVNQATLGLGRASGMPLGSLLLGLDPHGRIAFSTAAGFVAAAAVVLGFARPPHPEQTASPERP